MRTWITATAGLAGAGMMVGAAAAAEIGLAGALDLTISGNNDFEYE